MLSRILFALADVNTHGFSEVNVLYEAKTSSYIVSMRCSDFGITKRFTHEELYECKSTILFLHRELTCMSHELKRMAGVDK